MRAILLFLVTVSLLVPTADAQQRNLKAREAEFMSTPPLVGEPLPEV
jgi:hypothetical protein